MDTLTLFVGVLVGVVLALASQLVIELRPYFGLKRALGIGLFVGALSILMLAVKNPHALSVALPLALVGAVGLYYWLRAPTHRH